MRTEHEMKCAGLGRPVDARLTYAVEMTHHRFIGSFKRYYQATSEEHARDLAAFDSPGMEIKAVTLL